MATQPAHDRLDSEPFWQVQIVFDPDGTGADFAYTIGLHTRGLPELHIWARPSLGEDPGSDWMLSTNDRGSVLNEFAGLMVAGRLVVGSEVTHEYDGGHTRVTYSVDPPGDREELEALGVPEGVEVLPVRWSLHRAAEGPLQPLTALAERAAVTRTPCSRSSSWRTCPDCRRSSTSSSRHSRDGKHARGPARVSGGAPDARSPCGCLPR
jgi:hypothetical protein